MQTITKYWKVPWQSGNDVIQVIRQFNDDSTVSTCSSIFLTSKILTLVPDATSSFTPQSVIDSTSLATAIECRALWLAASRFHNVTFLSKPAVTSKST